MGTDFRALPVLIDQTLDSGWFRFLFITGTVAVALSGGSAPMRANTRSSEAEIRSSASRPSAGALTAASFTGAPISLPPGAMAPTGNACYERDGAERPHDGQPPSSGPRRGRR